MDKLRAQDTYADVINRTVEKYANTPGGAPPGIVIEAILQTQAEPDTRMSTGGGVPQGMSGLAMDSADVRLYQAKYGREPEMWHPEQAIDILANGVDARQESGGNLTDWHAAAFGMTGLVRSDGMTPGISDEKRAQGVKWMTAYLENMDHEQVTGVAELQPGAMGWSGKHKDYVAIGPGTEFPDSYHSVGATNLDIVGVDPQPGLEDIPGEVADALDPVGDGIASIIAAGKSWAPRIGLFLLGAVLLIIGLYLLVKPGAGARGAGAKKWRR